MIVTTDENAIEIHNRRTTQCIAFRPDGRHLLGAQSSSDLRQWKVDSGEEINPLVMKATGGFVYAVIASMDGRWIVAGDRGNKVIVWDAVTHRVAHEFSDHKGRVYAVDVSSDSTRIASGSEDHTVRIFDIVSGARVGSPLHHNTYVVGVKFSPDGSRIASASYQIPVVDIYDTLSGNNLFEIAVEVANWAPLTPLAWSSDGQQLLLIAAAGKITCFDTSTSHRSEWPIHEGNEKSSVVTHGQFIACSAGSSVSFWDYTTHQKIGNTISHTEVVTCISISHDGRYLACGRENGITIHNLTGLLPENYLRVSRISRIPLVEVNDAALKLWIDGNLTDAESKLSEEIAHHSTPSHHTFAARSLLRSHLRIWEGAVKDAESSLEIKQSPIGQIARSFALAGDGKQEVALDDFDFVFCDDNPSDNILLLVLKSILVFMCGKRKQAISRLRGLVVASSEGHYAPVLGNMYLQQDDYEAALQILKLTKKSASPQEYDPLTTIYLISNWNLDGLESIVWQRWCETLYTSGCIKDVGKTLEKIVSTLPANEKEVAHGRILQEIVTRTGQVTLLAWTGRSSACHSCLPSSPSVYSQHPFIPPCLKRDELRRRMDKIREVIPLVDALVLYGRFTRLQPVRFAHFHLHLPCIVFSVVNLKKDQADVYHAETSGLGNVEFTTADSLPLNEPRRLVFVDMRINGYPQLRYPATSWENAARPPETELDSLSRASSDTDSEMVQYSFLIEEVPSPPSETYAQALELFAHLGQPFEALLLLRQPDGAYKRVAADRKIVVRGMENNIPKNIRVEVLEIM